MDRPAAGTARGRPPLACGRPLSRQPGQCVAGARAVSYSFVMRESNTAKGRSRREQVLDAALEAFADRGYRGASMASIAERVGLTEPGLLHHFASKPELLRAVIEHHEKLQTERFFAVGDRSLAEALLDLARHHEADPRFIRFFTTLAAESVNPDHPAHDW